MFLRKDKLLRSFDAMLRESLMEEMLADGISIGIGYTLSLTLIGTIREILGSGAWFGIPVMGESFEPLAFLILAPGAFVTIGLLLGLQNLFSRWRGEKFIQG